jgi:hypothetical protein
MKVAQHEVLGNGAKEMSVPLGTIERLATGLSHAAQTQVSGRRSSRSSFVILTVADRPGRFAFLNCKPSPAAAWATFIRSLRDDLSRNPFFCVL